MTVLKLEGRPKTLKSKYIILDPDNRDPGSRLQGFWIQITGILDPDNRDPASSKG